MHYHMKVTHVKDGVVCVDKFHADHFSLMRIALERYTSATEVDIRMLKRCNDPESIKHKMPYSREAVCR